MVTRKIFADTNDALTVRIPTDRLSVAGVQYPAGATGAFALEGSIDGETWNTIQVRSAADETVLAVSVSAAGLHYADVSYCEWVRLRKTNAGSSTLPVALSLNHN